MSCAIGSTSVYHALGLSSTLETEIAVVTKSYRAKSLAAASETESVGVISNYHALGLTPAQEVTSVGAIVSECGIIPPTSVTAKSVIFDIADNYGDVNFMGIRSIEIVLNGSVIAMIPSTDFAAYATTTHSSYSADHAFNTTLSKTGVATAVVWLSLLSSVSNQRLIIVFNSDQTFDEIIVNNYHTSGGSTTRGVKNVAITSSTDSITDTTYNAAIANSTVLDSGVVFPDHTASNVADDQTVWTF